MTCVELFLLFPIIFTPLMLTQNIYLLIVLVAYIIPLDKRPAISVCVKFCKKIIGKAVMRIVRHDLQRATRFSQLCAG